MALRLKYAGLSQERIIVEEDVKKQWELATKSEDKDEKVTILPSYTALLKISKMKFLERVRYAFRCKYRSRCNIKKRKRWLGAGSYSGR